MTLARPIFFLLGLVLAGLVIFAVSKGDFWQEGAWLTSNPWGIVTLADLYVGLAVSALFIGLLERRWRAIFWIVPLPFLGNVWTIVWLVARFPEIIRRLRS